ncbi:hypothetical protein EWB00_011226 [Schistosoma japonicum]|uniref:Uncharacterized protein n=1 Tax=Schistosoma japonicum TaxID=6182 RepID=A0A4Z2DLP4_SCHJA|nr:hypothetical protein EWB00_011226 [Schistosoma japonicum]
MAVLSDLASPSTCHTAATVNRVKASATSLVLLLMNSISVENCKIMFNHRISLGLWLSCFVVNAVMKKRQWLPVAVDTLLNNSYGILAGTVGAVKGKD